MPRCEVAAYVASSAWDALTSEVNVHTATFQVHGPRWNLGRVTCRFSALVGGRSRAGDRGDEALDRFESKVGGWGKRAASTRG
jgi:hypothetical protein